MSSSGSIATLSAPAQRLMSVASHLHSQRSKVVVCRNLGPDVMSILEARPELDLVVWPQDSACERSWLMENISGATGVIVMLTDKVNAELLDKAGPSLKVVSTMSVGYEHIDLKEAAQRGLKVGYTPDVLTDAVADLSVMLALMAGRNGGTGVDLVQRGQWTSFSWAPFALCGPQLSTTATSPTRKIGFLGFGRIAQATLARLVPFGITHCLYSSNPSSLPNHARDAALTKQHKLQAVSKVDIDELARESDVLFVLAPGGSETYHVVNETLLRKMKRTSILVNASRGTLVDSDALAKALREGWIWGAGLDVVEGEPNVTIDHPLVKEPRCVIVPHIASATLETRVEMATRAAQNLIGAILGWEMPSQVDLSNVL
ncbi:uncharacterized protein BJ212DRAFT_1507679 [Suillus subaureus]|uniref:Glyoxylate reductase n=1 Tax=Suillus subaureus TaxID=48587 RepID=A0A9P7E9N2_9AGAM|nr:uncharacterized protein BJ212DRAFT_1507679 [Suillus subaureus]KAG1815179.1 hypothetical protein BJ212DRAFT_1507679 [Suillus subaureus]